MANRRFTVIVGFLVLGTLLALGSVSRTQDPKPQPLPSQPANPQGMDVLARGPIHEAYAEPIDYQPQATKVVPKQPPDPIEEIPPDQKPAGENVQWIPGYWSWDDDSNDYIWVSGIWRMPPPDRQWVPGHWDQTQDGWQWTPGFWQLTQQNQVEYLPPPPAPLQAAASTPAPSQDSIYIPGNWLYRDTRYVWRDGYWVEPRPGWVWIPAHYVWSPAGYVFVEGYWDFELGRRGLLFAPIRFTRRLWEVASWAFQPSYCVHPEFIETACFVRPEFYSYYFGDYFEPRYRRLGFVAWVDYRLGRTAYDPLFSYYRWSYREDPTAIQTLRTLYTDRFEGRVARPPRTLVQQTTIINNITNNTTNVTNITNIKNVTVLATMAEASRTIVHLQPLPQPERAAERKIAQQYREAGQQRAQAETGLVAKGLVPRQRTDPPRTVKVELPRRPTAAPRVSKNQPPPPPVTPRHELRNEPRPQPGAQPRTEPRPRTEPQPRPQPQPQPKTEPQPRPKTEPAPRPEPRPQPPRPQPNSEPQPPRPQPKTEPRPQPAPQPAPRPQPKTEAAPQPRPQPAPRPQPKTEPAPQPRPQPQPRPGTEPPRPAPRPQPQPAPKPKTEPKRP
jgi:hypothetical protein